MPFILVTNDDGYRSEGITALADALASARRGHHRGAGRGSERDRARADAAPAVETREDRRSACTASTARPTDCVNIAITQVFKRLPDLVVSGINKGWNLGDDVTYSGTVAGALEGALLGVPGLAVSLMATRGAYDFRHAAQSAATLADALLQRPLPSRTFLNVNVPKGSPKGFRVTVLARRNHVTSVAERRDPKGQAYFWIEEGQNEWHPHERSDYQAVLDGYVSVTPVQPDLTAHDALAAVEELTLGTRESA